MIEAQRVQANLNRRLDLLDVLPLAEDRRSALLEQLSEEARDWSHRLAGEGQRTEAEILAHFAFFVRDRFFWVGRFIERQASLPYWLTLWWGRSQRRLPVGALVPDE